MKVINGDYRIGFFALKDITAQTEVRRAKKLIVFCHLSIVDWSLTRFRLAKLFFDYGDKFFKAKGAFTPQNANQDTNSHDARKK
jgi:hypothetical protein